MDSYFWQERFEAWEDEKLEQYLRELEREQIEDLSEGDIGYIGGKKDD